MAEVDYFPRVQEVVLPILRDALGPEVTVSSWVNDIDYREYPIVNVRRLGGPRHTGMPEFMDSPVIEMTVHHGEGLVEAEELYTRALSALFEARRTQKVVDRGYLARVRETMGMTQFSSLFQDAFRVQGLIEVVVRPNREEP